MDALARKGAEKPSVWVIKSEKGTIRGIPNKVRDRISQLGLHESTELDSKRRLDHVDNAPVSSAVTVAGQRQKTPLYEEELTDVDNLQLPGDDEAPVEERLVLFTTSLNMIRSTYEDCLAMRKILDNHLVEYEEKDVSIREVFSREMKALCNNSSAVPPQLFLNDKRLGEHLERDQLGDPGRDLASLSRKTLRSKKSSWIFLPTGVKEIEYLSENGQLHDVLRTVKRRVSLHRCATCSGLRYVPCPRCEGSGKARVTRFVREINTLRCTHCMEKGLTPCYACNPVR